MIELNWPALQVIIPLFGAIFCTICSSIRWTRVIAIVSAAISFLLSLSALLNLSAPRFYAMGDWKAPIGIEYKLDNFSQPIIVYIFGALLFTLIFCRKSIIDELEKFTTRPNIIYVMILLIATGFAGMVATNDLFNLYVFLEISSLASYALISQGGDNRAVKGALDYLILGTVGASLILIGIGILYSACGTLNMDDINIRLEGLYSSRMVILGLGFFIVGALLKVALFPLHLWMIRAYTYAATPALVYISGLSPVIWFYVLLRFIYFVVDYEVVYESIYFAGFMRCFAVSAIISSSYLALRADSARSIIVYSAAAQIGYTCLMLISPSPEAIGVLASCVLADSILKIGLFASLSGALDPEPQESCEMLNPVQHDYLRYLTSFFLIFSIMSSVGIPITIGFINKINILSILINSQEYAVLVIVIISSILAFEYHYRFYQMVLRIQINNSIVLVISSLASFALLIMNEEFTLFISGVFAGVMNG